MQLKTLISLIFVIVMVWSNAWGQTMIDDEITAEEHYQLGLDAMKRNEQVAAICHLLQYLRLDENNPAADTDHLIIAQKRLGNLYLFYNDLASALRYYENGYKLAHELGDRKELGILYNLGVVHCLMHHREETLRCDSLIRAYPDIDPTRPYYLMIQEAYFEKEFGSKVKAMDAFKRAKVEVINSHLDTRYLSTPYSELTEMYQAQHQFDSALHYALLYHEIAEEGKVHNMLVDSHKYLMQLYTLKGEYDSAAYHQKMYVVLSDSLMKTSTFLEATSNWNDLLRQDSKQRIHGLESKISLQKVLLWGLTAILLLALGIAWLIYRQKLSLRQKNKEIYERNRELVDMERRREVANAVHPEEEESKERQKQDEAISDLSRRIIRLMDTTEEYCNPDFSLQSLAQLLNTNTKYLSQAINDCLGQNFRSLVNEYRVKKARQRLTDEAAYANYTIQAIAESVGYKSSANFIAAFKKITGLTPAYYQKMAKEDIPV